MQLTRADSQGEGREEQVKNGYRFSVNTAPAQPARLLGLQETRQPLNSG